LKLDKIFNDLILITPEVFEDNRGYFFESFNKAKYSEKFGNEVVIIQDNESKSSKGTLRGLHYQIPPYTQAKIVRVVYGEVLDVVVDMRLHSKTFGQWKSVILNDDNKKQLFIPRGYAHGFVVLSDEAIFSYKVDNLYMPDYEKTIIWNDDFLNIDWMIDHSDITLSEKDEQGLSFAEATKI